MLSAKLLTTPSATLRCSPIWSVLARRPFRSDPIPLGAFRRQLSPAMSPRAARRLDYPLAGRCIAIPRRAGPRVPHPAGDPLHGSPAAQVGAREPVAQTVLREMRADARGPEHPVPAPPVLPLRLRGEGLAEHERLGRRGREGPELGWDEDPEGLST